MGIILEYRHPHYAPKWTKIEWPFNQHPVQAARDLAANLAEDYAEDPDHATSIYDDIQIRHNGEEVEF